MTKLQQVIKVYNEAQEHQELLQHVKNAFALLRNIGIVVSQANIPQETKVGLTKMVDAVDKEVSEALKGIQTILRDTAVTIDRGTK